jgi:hypothetical protein
METQNAIIESIKIEIGPYGCLTIWLILDYGGVSQGFGGHALYLPSSFKHHKRESVVGHFIYRVLEIAGVAEWDELVGKAIRARSDNDVVDAIGHIVKDDWFCPRSDLK